MPNCLRNAFCFIVLALICASVTAAHAAQLTVTVRDQTGAPVRAIGEWRLAGGVARKFTTSADGTWTTASFHSGTYSLTVTSPGFQSSHREVTIGDQRSIAVTIVLQLAAASTSIDVVDKLPTLDSAATASRVVPRQTVQERSGSQPSRQTIAFVTAQPGWLLEANGVLHPRGSEYDTQFVVDGVPLLDNRSPAFAPAIDANNIQMLAVSTGGYPASFGRKLGGVVEITTRQDFVPGWHGDFDFDVGSFDSQAFAATAGYAGKNSSVTFGANGSRTGWFLDPPTLEDFTNHGDTGGLHISAVHKFSERDRLRFSLHSGASEFDVPNEALQQQAAQLQRRRVGESAGEISFEHVLTPNALFDLRGMVRATSATLSSNAESTPIIANQHRGITEGYSAASLLVHHGRHELQSGADLLVDNIDEAFSYAITDASAFDNDVLPRFQFTGARTGSSVAWYAQDRVHFGPLTASAGVRWDHYNLLVTQNEWSPRLAAAWRLPKGGIVLRASYDRILNTPAVENLLLASSAAAQQITPVATGLPVRPALGNFYEVGLTKAFGEQLRIDVNAFRRRFHNFADDDLLLNTGVSIPIAFSAAQIEGFESSLSLNVAQRFSWTLNLSNLSGTAHGPITGGLFLTPGADTLADRSTFRVSQDQRNTISSRARLQVVRRAWVALSSWYGSGLPVELDEGNAITSDPRLLSRVDLDRGRVRPSYSLDAHLGFTVFQHEHRQAQVQLTVANLTDHLNLINFAGLFSGTAIAQPRTVTLRMHFEF